MSTKKTDTKQNQSAPKTINDSYEKRNYSYENVPKFNYMVMQTTQIEKGSSTKPTKKK